MRKSFILTLAISLAIVSIFLQGGTRIINWGLTPNTKEQTPGIPASAREILEKHNGIFVGDTTKKEVYFTFDLGYEAGFTNDVLDILKANNIRAIFFLCGNYLKETDLVTRMIDDGHTIGNHTDHHRDLPTLPDDAIRKDIADFTTKFNEKYTSEIKHFRPGKGRFDERTLKIANEQNLKTVMWSGAIVDWGKEPINPTTSSDKITSRIHPGAILLFHISNSGMPKMLEQLVPKLTEKGYTIGDAGKL
ncbi:MAG: polysaccharide deacetylase family protein [Firmicutes bacterium]|nr:polysaccharide deacetylase family protein [Bacillota bacterium]